MPENYLSKMTPVQARLIKKKWPSIIADVQHRISCARTYCKVLSGLDNIIFPEFRDDLSHTYLYFPIQVEDKDKLQKYLIANGCDVGVQYSANVADLTGYKKFFKDCPNARKSYIGTVMLPTYPGFSIKLANKYAETVRDYCHKMK